MGDLLPDDTDDTLVGVVIPGSCSTPASRPCHTTVSHAMCRDGYSMAGAMRVLGKGKRAAVLCLVAPPAAALTLNPARPAVETHSFASDGS